MKINEINPFVRYVKSGMWNSKEKKWIVAPDCRLLFFKSGKARVEISNETFVATDGGLLIIPADTPYNISRAGEPFSYTLVDFDFSQEHSFKKGEPETADEKTYLKLKIIESCPLKEFSTFFYLENTSFSGETELLEAEFANLNYSVCAEEMMSAIMKQILITALRLKSVKKSKTSDLIEEITEFMNFHIKDKLDNDKIAEAFNYHPYYLSRAFKEITGVTMHKYFLDLKCKKAATYLASTNMSILEIANEIGFDSQSHFTGVFTKSMGETPSSYRKKHRN